MGSSLHLICCYDGSKLPNFGKTLKEKLTFLVTTLKKNNIIIRMIKKWVWSEKTMLRPAVVVSEQSGLIERNETQHLREHLCCGSCVSSPGLFFGSRIKTETHAF